MDIIVFLSILTRPLLDSLCLDRFLALSLISPTHFLLFFPVQEKQNVTEASSAPKPPEEPEGGKANKTQQLKKVFKEYGAVGVSFHICISLMSLGMFYLLISR